MIFVYRKSEDFLVAARLLSAKLIARKGQNTEPLIGVFVLQSTQPGVLWGKASAARDVYDQAGGVGEPTHGRWVAMDVVHGHIVELTHRNSFQMCIEC